MSYLLGIPKPYSISNFGISLGNFVTTLAEQPMNGYHYSK